MLSHVFTLKVRFVDTDAMGIVHHSRYFEYFEAARVALLDSVKLPYATLVKMGFHLPLVETNVRYKAPAKFDDTLHIETTLSRMEGIKFSLHYKVYRAKELLCESSTTHVFINKEGRPVRPPKEFLDVIK